MTERELQELKEKDLKAFYQLMNPFPGLRPFSIEESHLFFGREGQSDEVLTKLGHNRFVAVLGTSGSGKSSLMYCGLIPILHGGFMTDAGSDWRIVVARPGVEPIDNLAEALLSKDVAYNTMGEEDRQIRRAITSSMLRSSSLGLIDAVRQMNKLPRENVLILVDQFEELFRYNRTETRSSETNESLAFVNLLLEGMNQTDVPIYVALTMRSDFIGDCAQFPELTQKINDSHYLIPQMTRAQKRYAIEGPVAVGGGKIAPRLVQQLLNDVGDNPDQLPILQHALMRTWAFWADNQKEEEPMDLRHYQAIGRMAEALSQHANEAYDELSRRLRKICEITFKALTEAGTDNSGIRRPTQLKTIAAIAGTSEEEVVRVVDRFREPGRSLLMPPHGVALHSETIIDISHESLMRNWTRLKVWVEEEATSANIYLRLAEDAHAYQLGKAALWRMPDLQLAINWREEQRPTLVWGTRYHPAFERTMVFLETSEKAYVTEQRNKEMLQRRNLRRTRNFAIIAGLIGLLAIFLAVFGQVQSAEANKQRTMAEAAADTAEVRRVAAEASEQRALEQEAIAKLARDSAEVRRVQADSARLRAQVSEARALASERDAKQARDSANQRRIEAEQLRLEADSAKTDAIVQAQIAEEQRQAAERLRFQSIAKSMSVKSLQIDDPQRKGLIALQAYKFNEDYGIDNFDPDMYAGLYYALKDLKGDTLNHFKGHEGTVKTMTFSNAGQYLYTAGGDGNVFQWNIADPNRQPTTLASINNIGQAMAISPNDQTLVTGFQSNYVFVYNLGGSGYDSLVSANAEILDIEYLPDNSGFVTTGTSNAIEFCDLNTFTTVATPEQPVYVLAVSPDGQTLAGGDKFGNILLWDIANNFEPKPFPERAVHPVRSIAYSPNGRILAYGEDAAQPTLYIYDLLLRRLIGIKTGYNARISGIAFSNDSKLMAVSSFDRKVRVYVMDRLNDLPIILDDHDNWVWGVAFSPDGQSLVTGATDEVVRVWPMNLQTYADQFCELLGRELTDTEWEQYVGAGVPYESTCDDGQ